MNKTGKKTRAEEKVAIKKKTVVEPARLPIKFQLA